MIGFAPFEVDSAFCSFTQFLEIIRHSNHRLSSAGRTIT